jgi:hypothetical protein
VNTAHDPDWYEIRIQGHLDERWTTWFDGMTVEPEPAGVTVLRGAVIDQTALHGLLARLRDLGLPLISVASVDADPGADSEPTAERADR